MEYQVNLFFELFGRHIAMLRHKIFWKYSFFQFSKLLLAQKNRWKFFLIKKSLPFWEFQKFSKNFVSKHRQRYNNGSHSSFFCVRQSRWPNSYHLVECDIFTEARLRTPQGRKCENYFLQIHILKVKEWTNKKKLFLIILCSSFTLIPQR